MDSSEEEDFAMLLLATEEEEAAMPKKNRRMVRQHFEMRPVLVKFSTFQNFMNYLSHPLSLKTWKL